MNQHIQKQIIEFEELTEDMAVTTQTNPTLLNKDKVKAFLKTSLEKIWEDAEKWGEEKARKEINIVLEDVLKYVNHYQELLNMHDGGERRGFKSLEELINKFTTLKQSQERKGK